MGAPIVAALQLGHSGQSTKLFDRRRRMPLPVSIQNTSSFVQLRVEAGAKTRATVPLESVAAGFWMLCVAMPVLTFAFAWLAPEREWLRTHLGRV